MLKCSRCGSFHFHTTTDDTHYQYICVGCHKLVRIPRVTPKDFARKVQDAGARIKEQLVRMIYWPNDEN
jgi:hypothetical protein